MAGGRISRAARKVPLHQVGLGVGGAALAVSGLFGGLAQARDATPTIGAGQVTDGGPWSVTVTKARLFDNLPPLLPQKTGDRWVVVIATVEVTDTESRGDMDDILRVRGVTGLLSDQPSYVVLARDATTVQYLNPGMPEKLGFFWEQAAASPVPTSLDAVVYSKIRRADSLTGHVEWLDRTEHATLTLPVDDQRKK